MFGIGLPELILILALALIVVGPDKLPDLARSVAKGILELKKTATTLKDSLTEEGNPLAEIKPELEKASKALTDEVMGVTNDTWTGGDRGSIYDQENSAENSPDIIDVEPEQEVTSENEAVSDTEQDLPPDTTADTTADTTTDTTTDTSKKPDTEQQA
jgi:sec-independent protein translocase protein TatB